MINVDIILPTHNCEKYIRQSNTINEQYISTCIIWVAVNPRKIRPEIFINNCILLPINREMDILALSNLADNNVFIMAKLSLIKNNKIDK